MSDAPAPVEFPRISADITVNINDLRLRALKGEVVTMEEYRAAILKVRELFGKRVAAKTQGAVKTRAATKSKAKPKQLDAAAVDDLLKGL